MTRFLLLIQILIIACSLSCKKNAQQRLSKQIHISNEEIAAAILNNTLSIESNDSSLIKAKENCFSYTNYNPFITAEKGLQEIKKLQLLLADLPNHGLGNYLRAESTALAEGIAKYDSTIYAKKNVQDYAAIAQLEKTARTAWLDYAKTMRFGLLNADSIFIEKFHLPVLHADSAFYCKFFQSANVEEIKPVNFRYGALKQAYSKLRQRDSVEFEVLPTLPTGKTTVGKQYKGLPLLRKRFGLASIADSLPISVKYKYDSLTFNKVKDFQELNGLSPDGVIGPSTWKMLNLSPADKQQKMEITLERFRWQYNVDTVNYIQANIPEYMLRVFENGKEVRKHAICVGMPRPKSYNKFKKKNRPYHIRNYETPEFVATLENIVVNPTWVVPGSISRLEILPNLQANPAYARANNYKIYVGGEEIVAEDYDWNKISMSDFNYQVVQEPGSINALGKIKFLFPNPYSVYFHDTPSKSYFKRDIRAVSHGCMRTQNPIALGDYLMEGNEKYEKAKKGSNLTYFTPSKPLQVVVTYYTCWVEENGNVQYRDDVYGKDREVWNKLKTAIAK